MKTDVSPSPSINTGTSKRLQVLVVVRLSSVTSLLRSRTRKSKLRIIFIVVCVGFPLSWNRNGQAMCRGAGSTASDILDMGKRGAGIFI